MLPDDDRRILLCGAEDDPATQMLAEDILASGRSLALNEEPDAARHDRVLFCDQATFLSRFTSLPGGAVPATVLLRQPGQRVGDDGWEPGLVLLAALADRIGAAGLSFACLTEAAATRCTDLLGRPVAVLRLQPAGASGGDRKLAATLQTDGVIATGRGQLQRHAQNWAQLRLHLRFDLGATPPGDEHDLASYANATGASTSAEARTYLCVVTNGVGLGHLTRLLAIADALRQKGAGRIVFWSFSQAAGIIAAAGYDVVQRATAAHLGCDYADWIRWEKAALETLLADLRPAAVLYDSSGVDPFVTGALASAGNGSTALVLIRRAMWQETLGAETLNHAQHCALVLEPGDLAQEKDQGATARLAAEFAGYAPVVRTQPVVLRDGNQPVPRRQARRELGLRWFGKPVCLVSLGGEAFGRDASLVRDIVALAKAAGVRLIWARSPLARAPQHSGLDPETLRHVFPLGRLLTAFDGIISACGYNSFHECLAFSRAPVLFIPTLHQRLDNQKARADHAAEMGWADILDPEDARQRAAVLKAFLAKVAGRQLRPRPDFTASGADEMAERILSLSGGGMA